MTRVLRDIVARNRAGKRAAIPSVCSAQPDVLRASLDLAQRLDRPIVIEATSNQVNQDGGYTGITPDQFINYVHGLANKVGTDRSRITFGGDHLGPQAWRNLPASAAMDKARTLVRDYVRAGFHKIHLDCSEGCADDPAHLGDTQTAERSADLARVCAQTHDDLLFVVGTEVPPPGGARSNDEGEVLPTLPAAARATLSAHADTFGDMTPMIGGLVVQPGVEFTPSTVHHLPLDRDPGLLAALDDWPNVCLEAHSTDYQGDAVFPRLAELGFAFQKVGPALTFAYRRALYALDQLRGVQGGVQHGLKDAMESVMTAQPEHWAGHYHGDDATLFALRHEGLADRIRYYWPHPMAQKAVAELRNDLKSVPDAVLATAFDTATLDRAQSLNGDLVQKVIDASIQQALAPYFFEEAP